MIEDVLDDFFRFESISENVLIALGNSLEVLKDIKSESIDACITDPPYFIDGLDNNWNTDLLEKKISKAGVIGSMPVGMKFDPKQGKVLQRFIQNISIEVFRILKPGGFYLSFSQGRLYHRMSVAIEDCGFEIRDMLIWQRNSQSKAFSQDHFIDKMDIPEDEKNRIKGIIGNRKTPQLRSESEPIVLAQKPKIGTFVQNYLTYNVGLIDTSVSLNNKTPSTIINIPKPSKKEREESTHLTKKPVALMEHLIKIFTSENSIICDPFMGSGSTGVACINLNRRFIGIELNNLYYNESKNRLKNHLGTGDLIK